MITKTIKEIHQMIGGELYINKQNLDDEIQGICIDSRKVMTDNIYFAIVGERVDGHIYIKDVYTKGSKLAIVSSNEYIDQDIACILVEDVVGSLQQLATTYRAEIDVTVIGITGSNGKTSCKDLLASILDKVAPTIKTIGNRNNEIGVPLTLLELSRDTKYAVVEMGMENLEDIHFLNTIVKPDYGIVTNVGVAHLENLKTLDNIGRAKLELVDGIQSKGCFIYNGDDVVLKKIIKEKNLTYLSEVTTFGLDSDNVVHLESFEQTSTSIEIKTNIYNCMFSIPTIGKHQALNALAALACAKKIGVAEEVIQDGFSSYQSTSMRNELRMIGNCTILNDAYKSNPQSALAAIETFESINKPYKIMVLGDMLDLGPNEKQYHLDLGEIATKYCFDEMICFGDLSLYILFGAFSKQSGKIYKHFSTHDEMSLYLKKYLEMDCAILLKGSRGMALDKVLDTLIGEEYE